MSDWVPPKFSVRPSVPPAKAVAKNTAGKYGVKNTSGRSRERHHRAPVAKATQEVAKPILKSGDGRVIPCQPCRNSSINFTMVTSHQRGASKTRSNIVKYVAAG